MWGKLLATFKDFNYSLYAALATRLFLPTIYQTFRVSILGSLPDTGQIDIASQLVWIQVLVDVIEKAVLSPLYYCLGQTLENVKETKGKIKTGLMVSTIVYVIFSAIVYSLAWPLIKVMGQNETLHEATVDYIRIELLSVTLGGLTKILMVVFVMLEWKSMLYFILVIQMVTSSGFDYGLAVVADMKVMGIAYSSVCSSFITFSFSLGIVWKKLDFSLSDVKNHFDFTWLKTWTKVGFYSGLECFVRNVVYLIVVLRAMNELNEQGSYWVANTFIWNWLLLPILPLNELFKQDVAAHLNKSEKKHHLQKLLPYFILNSMFLIIWIATHPGWLWFLKHVMNADKPDLVFEIIKLLVPCYAVFTFGYVLNGLFYALGKTGHLLVQTLLGNAFLVTLFTLYSNGILFQPSVYSIASIFGSGLVLGTFTTSCLYFYIVSKIDYKL